MKNIVIIGAGDLGKEVVWLIEDINRIKPTYLILGFLDDDRQKQGKEFCWYKVLGGLDYLEELNEKTPVCAVVAVKDSMARKRIVEAHPDFVHWESIIHPNATIASSSTIGGGSILFPNVTVSVDSKLGCFGVYYIQSMIGSDCRIGNYVTAMFGAAVMAHSELSEGAFLPVHACIQSNGGSHCNTPPKNDPAVEWNREEKDV